MDGASALVPLNDCEWQEIKNKVTLEALLAMMLAMCQGLTEEDEKVFADFELECFRECLLWLQAVHADNKTTSKVLGKAIGALTMIRSCLKGDQLFEVDCKGYWKYDPFLEMKPFKEKFEQIPRCQCLKKREEMLYCIDYFDNKAHLDRCFWWKVHMKPAFVLLKDAVEFLPKE